MPSSTSTQNEDKAGDHTLTKSAAQMAEESLDRCLQKLQKSEPGAVDELLNCCLERLTCLASRMLKKFPRVRRWEETGDVLQNALIRLHRALRTVTPLRPRDFLNLAAVQIERELFDLARRYGRNNSHARNHDTNSFHWNARDQQKTDTASAPNESLDRWTAFHNAIASLPESEREVFHLIWYLGVDQQQASDLLGCSTRTIKRRWQSARHSIHLALDGSSPNEGLR